MGACVSKCKCSPTSTADSLCGGSPTSNHHHVQDPLPADADADPDAAADASPTPTTTASTSLLSTTSSVSMATSTISSSSATCSSSVFVKARPRLQGSELETSWDVVVLDPSKNKLLSAVTASSSSSSTPRVLIRGGHPLPSNDPGRSKRARPVSPRPAPRPGCKKPCTSPKRTGTPASGRQHQRAEQEASFLPRVGRHRHSRSRSKSRVTLESSSRGAMAAAGVGGGELADDLNNPLISMDCFIFL